MKVHIDNNEALAIIQNPPTRTEPSDSIDIPLYSLQLAKACEFLYHEADSATVTICMPKFSKK